MNTVVLPSPEPGAAWRRLHAAACAPYRAAGRFAWHFARGKLGRDPVFRALVEQGLMAGRERVVDIGCGQGLLASLLHEARTNPGPWPAITAREYTGIELMPADVKRATAAVGERGRFVCDDMRRAEIPRCDLVVILDVLHYVDHADQAALLARVHGALQPRGRLLLRIGDQADARGYAWSRWTDTVITWVRGHRVPPTFGRTAAEWRTLLEEQGFAVQVQRMSQGTPFANTLLVADCT